MRKMGVVLAAAFLAHALTGSVLGQPSLSKVFTPSTIGPGSVSAITFTITNGSGSPVSDLAFTDSLPAAITIADPANASTNCIFGVMGLLSAPDGGSTITLMDAQVGGFSSCTITVDVTASTPGMHTNPAITLSSSAGSNMSSAVDLTVTTGRPGFSKAFSPSSISLGGRSTLTFTIDNSSSANDAFLLGFVDAFPADIEVAGPPNASSDCSGLPSITAVPGSNLVSFSNGSVGAGLICTVTVDVISTGTGMLDNVSGELTFFDGDVILSSGKASATLVSSATPISLIKKFTDDPVAPGDLVTLEFTIFNFDRSSSATDVAFTDDLTTVLAGLTFDSLVSEDCLGSVTGLGGTTIGLSGGMLSPEGSCTIQVRLAVPLGATPGNYTNTTSVVNGTVDGSPVVGNMASDDLFVLPIPIFTKEFIDDPVAPGDTVTLRFTITNTDPASSLTGIAFTDDIGGAPPPDGRAGAIPGLAANGLVAMGGLVPEPLVDPCGAGSLLTIPDPNDTLPSPPFPNLPPDPTLLVFTGGSLAPAGMMGDSCTFDVVLDVPTGVSTGSYPNLTSSLTATPMGAPAARDDLTIVGAPFLTKDFTDDPVPPGGTVTLSFTLSQSAEAPGDATGISFTDDLDALGVAGLTVNLPPSPDPPCGAGSSLTAPGNVLTLAGGTLMVGQDCTFSVTLDIPGLATPGSFTNTTSDVSATVLGLPVTSNGATDVLEISGLTFTKEFVDDPVIAGDFVTLRFTIANIHPTEDATGISFSDNLAAVLPGTPDLSAVVPGPVNTCGGMMSGSTSLSYSGGSLTAGTTCTIELAVLVPVGTADGTYGNLTGSLSATQGGGVTIDPAEDTLVVDSSRLQLTKSFTDDPVAPGASVLLEFVLTNLDATRAASAIAFTDDLGATLTDLTFDAVEPGTTCSGTTGTGTDMIGVSNLSLAAGASCILRVSLTVPGGAAAGSYSNTTSTVTGTIGGLGVTGPAASDSLDVIQTLDFSKSFDGPTTATGTAVLTFTITNPGTETASNIAFSDNLDDVISGLIATSLPALPCGAGSSITGISLLTFSGGELAPSGGTCSFDVEVLVPGTATAGTHSNTTSNLFQDGLKVANPATDDLVIEPPPVFQKHFSPSPILAGLISTLVFFIDNTGSALDASNLAFTDNLPAGVVVAPEPNLMTTCGGTVTAMAGGGTVSFSGGSVAAGADCAVNVNVTSSVAGSHVNTTGDLTSTSGNSGTASGTLMVLATADIAVTKTDGVTSATPGGLVTYTIVVTNNGPSPDPNVSLTDTFPSPLTCSYTSSGAGGATGNTAMGSGDLAETLNMPAGSSVTYMISCDIDSDATGTLSNTASTTQSTVDVTLGNNSATDDDTVLIPQADLSISKSDGVTEATPGESVTYSIVVTNNGPSDDPMASVSDSFPADLTCTYTSMSSGGAMGNTTMGSGDLAETLSMPAASSVTYEVTCDIDSSATGTLSNTATVSASVTDPTPGNNSATDNDTLTPAADLSLAKDDGGASVVPGANITYTLTVTNSGPSDSTGGTVSDTLPSGLTFVSSVDGCSESGGVVSCSVPALANGDSTDLTFVVMVDAGQTSAITNSATVSGNENDPNAGNDTGTDGTPLLGAEADLSLEKDDGVLAAVPGSNLIYTLTITNNGPSDSSGGSISDPLPSGLTFDSSASGCSETAGTVNCSFGALNNGASVELTFVVTIPVDQTSDFTNTATVTGFETDPESGNDSASHATPLLPLFSKAFSPNPIAEGGNSTLTFTIDNSSNTIAATQVTFADNLPAGMIVANPSNASNACGGTLTADPDTGSISLSGGTAPAGSTCTIEVDVTVASAGDYLNTTETLTSSLGMSSAASDTLTVVDGVLFITKAFVPPPGPGPAAVLDGGASQPLLAMDPLRPGDQVDLEYTITNTSTVFSLSQIAFMDDLDAVLPGLGAVGLPIAGQCGMGSNTSGTSVIALTGGTLAPDSSCTFRVTVQIPADAIPGTYASTSSAATALASGAPVMAPAAVAQLVIVDFEAIPFLSDLGLVLMAGLLALATWRRLLLPKA